MKIQKKNWGGGGGGRVGGRVGLGGEGGCDRRSEVFVKIQKKNLRGGGMGGVMVDVNREVKFFVEIKKYIFFLVGGSGWGVRMDVHEDLKFL